MRHLPVGVEDTVVGDPVLGQIYLGRLSLIFLCVYVCVGRSGVCVCLPPQI